jgi:hypothetical protein
MVTVRTKQSHIRYHAIHSVQVQVLLHVHQVCANDGNRAAIAWSQPP